MNDNDPIVAGHTKMISIRADWLESLEKSLAEAKEENARLKAELDGEKKESANWHQETKIMILERNLWKQKAEALAEVVRKAFKIINNCHAICSEDGMDCVAETSDLLKEALAAYEKAGK